MNLSEMLALPREEIQEFCRQRCLAVGVTQDTALCRVLGHIPMYVDTRDDAIVPRLLLDGFWEMWVTMALGRLIQRGWRCIDVGANHGYYTALLAEVVGPTGSVLALEPNPHLFQFLSRTVRANGFQDRVRLHQAAAGATTGTAELRFTPHRSGSGTIVPDLADSTPERVPVKLVCLDDLAAGVDFLKIDAEGADYQVLAGARRLLARSPGAVVLLEHAGWLYPDGTGAAHLHAALAGGYSLQHIAHDGDIRPVTVAEVQRAPGRLWDLLVSRRGCP